MALTLVFNVSTEEAGDSSNHDVSQSCNNPRGLTTVSDGFDEIATPGFFVRVVATVKVIFSLFVSKAARTDLAMPGM